MKDTFDQHAGQSPPWSPSGDRQAAQSGGSAASRTKRKAADRSGRHVYRLGIGHAVRLRPL
jgi:hypothetical protein